MMQFTRIGNEAKMPCNKCNGKGSYIRGRICQRCVGTGFMNRLTKRQRLLRAYAKGK